MSATKHTPGPWAVATDDHERSLIATVGSCGARSFGRRFDHPYEVNYELHTSDEADAALCAAAPELLEALESAVSELGNYTNSELGEPTSAVYVIEECRAVLAKARGETP